MPINQRIGAVARSLGNKVGNFLEWNRCKENRWGRFIIHFRAEIDLVKPIKREMIIREQDGRHKKVIFKYKLVEFCYVCDRLDHGIKDCRNREEEKYSRDETNCSNGPWLHATPYRRPSQRLEDKNNNKDQALQARIMKRRHGDDGERRMGKTTEKSKNVADSTKSNAVMISMCNCQLGQCEVVNLQILN